MTHHPLVSQHFRQTTSAPVWEGVAFPGLDPNDPHAKVFEAPVSPLLSPYIQAIWFMTWDIPASTFYHGIGVPIPCVKISAKNSASFPVSCHLLGPKNKGVMLKFGGGGQGLGIDFRPGGLYPFVGKSLDTIANSFPSIEEFFPDFPAIPKTPWDLNSAEVWRDNLQNYLEARLPNIFPNHLPEIEKTIQAILGDHKIAQIDDLLEHVNISKRTLQRIFQTEVGLSVKDVLRVARFHQAIKAMNGAKIESFAQFALESGYFDQPHMVNDFKKLIDESPKIFKKYW